jgi:stage II sporulation protein D
MSDGRPVETRRTHIKRLAAMAAGATGLAACAPGVGGRTTTAIKGPEGQRRVRVGLLVDVDTVRVGAAGDIVAAEGPVGQAHTGVTMRSGDSLQVQPSDRGIAVAWGGQSAQFESLLFRSSGQSGFVTVDGAPYRGSVAVTSQGGALTVVNDLGLEDYVQGVVAMEMGPRARSEMAALEAQAVAARTYAVANMGRFASLGFDLRAGVSDQGYLGAGRETDVGNLAVHNTRDFVVSHEGAAIAAFYHSTCGYATAAPEESFRSVQSRPYLRSVSDQYSGGHYCEPSPRFRWQVEWAGTQLRDVLRTTVPRSLGIEAEFVSEIRDVEVRETGRSGRATEIRVRVERGEIPVFGPDVRAVFRTPEATSLGSTALQLVSDRENDRLVRLVASGAGWGHGVGMCQWGAIGRARAGHDYRSILQAYYPGTSITRWSS